MDADKSLSEIGDASVGMAPDRHGDSFYGSLDDLRIYNYALSQAEIVSLADQGTLSCPFESVANLYDEEPVQSKAVNFKDYTILIDWWLEKQFWPINGD